MGSIYSQFIATCWDNLGLADLPKNYISVSEVPNLVTEMEAFLGVLALLTKPEMDLIQKMADDKPTLKLFQRDVERFILRLAKFQSMEELLQKRANTLKLTLTRLLDNHTTYSFRPRSMDDTASLRGKFDRLISSPRPLSEPVKVKEETKTESKDPKYGEVKKVTVEGPVDVEELQRKVAHLERLCLLYEEKLGKTGTEKLDGFKKALDEQDKLIKELQKERLPKKNWLVQMPFVKQFLHSGSREYPGVIADVVALFLAFLIIQNILKLVYYVMLWNSPSNISYSWIQQMPWLEYWIYSLNESLEKA